AYIYFIDNDLGYSKDVGQLRKDVYGLPFMPIGGVDKHNPIKTYGEIRGKGYTKEIWIKYKDKIIREINDKKPSYVLILGSPHEFPEYRSHEATFVFFLGTYVFSDLYYVGENIWSSAEPVHIGEEKIHASVGRISIEYADDYFHTPKTFERKAYIHSMHAMYKYPPLGPRIPSHFVVDELVAPIIKTLTRKDVDFCTIFDLGFCDVSQPNIGEIVTGHESGKKQGGEGIYYVDYAIGDEKHPNNIDMNLKDYSLVVVGWHGYTRGIVSLESTITPTNVHSLIFTGIPCLICNEGDYAGTYIGDPSATFPHYLLPHGATLIGSTQTSVVFLPGISASPGVTVTFVDQLTKSKTVGDAWLKTMKKMVGLVSAESTIYARNEFRLLGDPALNTASLDDPEDNNISVLPSQFSLSLNLSYNKTILNNLTVVNVSVINVSTPIPYYSVDASYYSNATGAPIVPAIYVDIPMPLNQTLSNVTATFSDDIQFENLTLSKDTIYILTPNGTVIVPGYIFSGTYPAINYSYSLVSDPSSRLLKISVFPLQYDIDNSSATAYKNINITINTRPVIEEPIYAKVHVESSPASLLLHQSENETILFHVYNDPEASTTAMNVTMTCTLPSDLDIISTDGNVINHNVTWNIGNLTTGGVNASRSVELTIKAPESIITTTIKYLNLTVTYTDPSNYTYTPTTLKVPVSLISPKQVDLEVVKIEAPSKVKVGSTVNVTAIIRNSGKLGISGIPVTLFVDGKKVADTSIEELPPEESTTVEFSFI
ncbi:MAG: hypothetical protein DRP08_06645, partial [Candidatus Aenigmatarchaeota archaeon]